jgi:hypothetical protein
MSDQLGVAMRLLNINLVKEESACLRKIEFSYGVMCAMQGAIFILRKDAAATMVGGVGSVTS